MVDDFNDACLTARGDTPCPVMVLSLRAGGIGLNLTGADRVIHLDRWWNPAVEDQASDRVHRIGQQSTVFIHTLTGEATIEKAIEQIFAEKRQLAADLLGAACGDDVATLLGGSRGFLNLVDPQQFFIDRLTTAAQGGAGGLS